MNYHMNFDLVKCKNLDQDANGDVITKIRCS